MKRSGLALIVALLAGIAVFGAAATLGVTSKKVDSFGAPLEATTSSSTPGDTVAPTVGATEFYDSNLNGVIDEIRLTYSEALAATTATGPWTIAGGPTGLASTDLIGVSVSTNVITLSFSETLGTPTSVTTAAPTLTVSLDNSSGAVKDQASPANSASSFTDRPTTDKAAPFATQAEYFDTSNPLNGIIDQIKVTYSEDLANTTATAPWSFTGGPTGMSAASPSDLTGVGTAGSVITLTISETNGDDTVVTTVAPNLTVSLDNSSSAVKDLATVPNSAANLSGRTTADRAAPIPVSFTLTGGGNPSATGRPDRDDTHIITFSEPLAPGSVCKGKTTATFSLQANEDLLTATLADGAPEVLTYTSAAACTDQDLNVGSITLGTGNYVVSPVTSITFTGTGNNATEVHLQDSGRQLRLVLGQQSSNATADATTTRVSTWVPSPDLTDPSQNAVARSITRTGVQF